MGLLRVLATSRQARCTGVGVLCRRQVDACNVCGPVSTRSRRVLWLWVRGARRARKLSAWSRSHGLSRPGGRVTATVVLERVDCSLRRGHQPGAVTAPAAVVVSLRGGPGPRSSVRAVLCGPSCCAHRCRCRCRCRSGPGRAGGAGRSQPGTAAERQRRSLHRHCRRSESFCPGRGPLARIRDGILSCRPGAVMMIPVPSGAGSRNQRQQQRVRRTGSSAYGTAKAKVKCSGPSRARLPLNSVQPFTTELFTAAPGPADLSGMPAHMRVRSPATTTTTGRP